MISLKTKNSLPKSSTLITILSASEDHPSIRLSVEEVRQRLGSDWVPDNDNRRQVLTFIDADGEPSALAGKVPLASAVEAEGVYKVVIEAEVAIKKTAAREAGGFSGKFAALSIVRVVEVWEDAKKPLWKAPAAAPAGAADFDPSTGKISKAA